MSRLDGTTVVLGVSGGIAAYKAPEVVRALTQEGARVRVVMTRAAQQFITPLTLQTLSGEPVASDLFDLTQESEIGHIALADSADALLIAPATADVVGKLAGGIADDLLTTIVLATRAKVVLAPAMNVHMLENPVVQENLAKLSARGMRIVAPDSGFLACGYEGQGRLPDAAHLLEEVATALAPKDMSGEHVLVTAGPTREYLDPVRFLSNRSSGKMGYAIARAATRRGASVVLVSGPTNLPDPRGVTVVRVESAGQMASVVAEHVVNATVVVAAAAVADYRPARRGAEKEPKQSGAMLLPLESTPDVVAGVAKRKHPGMLVVGFAAETTDVELRARAKLARKSLDLIVANDVSAPGVGFDVDTNAVSLIDASTTTQLPLASKDAVADAILDRVLCMRVGRRDPNRGAAPVRGRAKVSRLAQARSRRPRGVR
jgi:phosphopantothenoylcysteine decarboxylase/phosphopantothenate--cysteine ligase